MAPTTRDAAHVDDRLQSGPPHQRAELRRFEGTMADGEEARSGHLRISAAGPPPAGVWSLDHPVVTTVALALIIVAIVAPICVRLYSHSTR